MLNIHYKASSMNDDVNDEVPNGAPKILIPSNGIINWDGVLKSSNKPEDDHVTHFLGWIEKHITQSSI